MCTLGLCYCELVTRHPSCDRANAGIAEAGPYRVFYSLVGELTAVFVAGAMVLSMATMAAVCAIALVSSGWVLSLLCTVDYLYYIS